jgi:hypothetical protein
MYCYTLQLLTNHLLNSQELCFKYTSKWLVWFSNPFLFLFFLYLIFFATPQWATQQIFSDGQKIIRNPTCCFFAPWVYCIRDQGSELRAQWCSLLPPTTWDLIPLTHFQIRYSGPTGAKGGFPLFCSLWILHQSPWTVVPSLKTSLSVAGKPTWLWASNYPQMTRLASAHSALFSWLWFHPLG